jgi:hypothetical protein
MTRIFPYSAASESARSALFKQGVLRHLTATGLRVKGAGSLIFPRGGISSTHGHAETLPSQLANDFN